jgi:hypothetical protein
MDPEELLQSKVNQSIADGRLGNGRGLELVGCLIIDAVSLPRSDEEMAEVRSERRDRRRRATGAGRPGGDAATSSPAAGRALKATVHRARAPTRCRRARAPGQSRKRLVRVNE